jgi:hypothetical protein
MDPIQKNARNPKRGHRIVLSNPVRCCSAFAYTSNAPTTLDPRCSALGCEPGASHNGQVIGSGQAAAPIHRIHHSNIQTSIPSAAPILAAFGYLYRLLVRPSAYAIYHHRTRARVINYWHQGRQRATSVPPDHLQRNNEENPSRTARARHPVTATFAQNANCL